MLAQLRAAAARIEFPVTWSAKAAWAAAILAIFAALAVAVDTGGWIVRAYSPLPFWDQWEVVADFAKIKAGTYRVGDLFGQHGEHRILFPRLVFFADLWLGRGRDIINLMVIAAVQLLHAALLIRLLGPLRRPGLVAAAAAVLALLTFLGQWENLVWGFQVQFVAVYMLATAAYVLLAQAVQAQGRARGLAFAGCCGCLVVAVFSMANGLAGAGLAVLLAAVLGAPRWMTAALAGLTAACAVLYFHGYAPVAGHSTLAYAVAHPADYLTYVANYVGNIAGLLTQRPNTAKFQALLATGPMVLGVAGLLLALAALVREARARFADRTSCVLLAVMALVLASAALTALGRLNFGIDQAHASRYQTPGAVFWAVQVIYWARAAAAWPAGLRGAAGLALAGLFGLLIWSQARQGAFVDQHAVRLRAAADALRSGVRDDSALAAADRQTDKVIDRAEALDRYDLSIYAEPYSDWRGKALDTLAKRAPAQACIGAFDTLNAPPRNAPDQAVAAGWAWDLSRDRLPQRIVMTNAAGVVVGFASSGVVRPDVKAARAEVDAQDSGWTGFARLDGRPVQAFALLSDGAACLLGALPGNLRN